MFVCTDRLLYERMESETDMLNRLGATPEQALRQGGSSVVQHSAYVNQLGTVLGPVEVDAYTAPTNSRPAHGPPPPPPPQSQSQTQPKRTSPFEEELLAMRDAPTSSPRAPPRGSTRDYSSSEGEA